jgi:catechol 2,3-dioxygenase-like lactoylglutathione lyase family enzyme
MPTIVVDHLDHLVLTVQDIAVTCDFYSRVLGMDVIIFGEGRQALRFGNQKINLHQAGAEFEPKAQHPTPGSADLCFIVQTPLEAVVEALHSHGVAMESGMVERSGATSKIRSVYLRDPDGNLLELSNPFQNLKGMITRNQLR